MNTILVPVDFMDASKHTVNYALQLAADWGIPKVVLYHAYSTPVLLEPDPMMPTMVATPYIDIEELKKNSEIGLQTFKNSLSYSGAVEVETLVELNDISTGIEEAITSATADLVVIGINEAGALEQSLIGSSAVGIAKNASVPVIVVPPHVTYTPVKEIAFASDLKDVKTAVPLQHIVDLVEARNAKLFIVNVQKDRQSFEAGMTDEIRNLYSMFEHLQPDYQFVDKEDFIEGINYFTEASEVDLLIVVPKERGWFEELFHTSKTKKLAYNSKVPLMVMH